MTKFKGLVTSTFMTVVAISAFALAGCGGVSEEQLQQLNDLDAEVQQLEQEVNQLKSEKSKLEREVAEEQAKADQFAKEKEQTKMNLERMAADSQTESAKDTE